VELKNIANNLKEFEYEKKTVSDEYKEFLLTTKEFEVLQYSYTQDGKKYLSSLFPEALCRVEAEKKELENKINRIIEECMDDLFILRTEQCNNMKTQQELLQKRKTSLLSIIHKYGAFDVATGGTRYTQTVDKNKKTFTKKNFITAFVGYKPHHKWVSVTEFEKDWAKYFGKNSKTLSCIPITESRKRERDTGIEDNTDVDEHNPFKK
jgi:hypothetical protein